MGMYDYINKNGDQVKCFYVPCITIHDNKDTNGKEVCFYTSGGQLKGYAEGPVPFMTPYYNYGHHICYYGISPAAEQHGACGAHYKRQVFR